MAQTHILSRPKSLADDALKNDKVIPDSLRKKPRILEFIIQSVLLLCGLISIITTVGILYTLGENSILFFRQQAFEQAKFDTVEPAFVMNMGNTVHLAKPLNRTDNRLVIALGKRASQPFEIGQILEIGEESLLVTAINQYELEVERGYQGGNTLAHEGGSAINIHTNKTVLLEEELDGQNTLITLPPNSAGAFSAGDDIRIEQEMMRVIAVDEEASYLTVERGTQGTNPVAHHQNLPIFIAKPVTLSEFFSGTQWNPQLGRLGIWPLLNATLMTTLFALIISLPVGLGVAIYLSEYATDRIRGLVKPVLELLVGVPTVVYGYFALTWLTPLLQNLLGVQVKQFNTLSAGLVMGIMIIPTIASISEDALNSVPRALRHASYALGATRSETTRKVVLPAAVSGIMAAFLLGISRAVGETMIVALAAGAGPNFTFNPLEGAETMTGHIARISSGDISYNTIDYNSLFAIGLLLFALTLLFNLMSGAVTRRFREAY